MNNRLNLRFNIIKYILNYIQKLNLFYKKNLNNFKKDNINDPNFYSKSLLEKKNIDIKERLPFEFKYPESYRLQKRLALMILDIDKIDKNDIKYLEHKKCPSFKNNNDLIGYRIDFHNKDELEDFKKKYLEYLL